MNEKNTLLILWIIFGFIFITAIDSILYLITYLLYFVKFELGLSLEIMYYSMPISTLILYVLTTFFIFRRLKVKSNIEGIYLINFPKKVFIGLALISLVLNPITNKLSGLYAENLVSTHDFEVSEYFGLYGMMTLGINSSRWLIFIVLIMLFLNKLSLLQNKNHL